MLDSSVCMCVNLQNLQYKQNVFKLHLKKQTNKQTPISLSNKLILEILDNLKHF